MQFLSPRSRNYVNTQSVQPQSSRVLPAVGLKGLVPENPENQEEKDFITFWWRPVTSSIDTLTTSILIPFQLRIEGSEQPELKLF